MKKYLMVAAAGDAYISLYKELHEERNKRYAEHWENEYVFYTKFGDIAPHKSLTWTKIWAIQDMFKQTREGDIVSVIDADICIVRGDIELTTRKSMGFTFDLWHGGDLKGDIMNGPNNGVLALKNNQFTRDIWTRIWDSVEFDHMPGSQDNLAFNTEIKKLSDQEIADNIEILPRELNVTLGSRIADHLVRFRHFAGTPKEAWRCHWQNIPLTF